MTQIRETYAAAFSEAHQQLNPQQQRAVDRIEGPVLVIAGPGTGKTQILALRIGNILRKTDSKHHNILCLTYTDAGTIAMRQRLLQFLGPDAYNVHIHTFHAFCNQVIQENLGLFGGYKELQLVTDLEKVDVFETLIDAIPNDHVLKRLKGDAYFEKWRMMPLFETMKREFWTPAYIEERADAFVESEKADNADYRYRRKYTDRKTGKVYQAGDLKEAKVADLVQKMDVLKAAARQYESYQQILSDNSRYDYSDMILWVLEAFRSNKTLLRRYQERYHYFLVDEYQDTNGAQNDILDLLCDYWESPNVFAVGDDDQSIFRFQGANMENMLDFVHRYTPEVVVLTNNYRSDQRILDAATTLIQRNEERLVQKIPNLTKELHAAEANAQAGSTVRIRQFVNTIHEEAQLFQELSDLYHAGHDLNKVAVIYRNHRQVADLVKVLEANDIPINLRRKINILDLPFINNVLDILTYISAEIQYPGSGEDVLFRVLHLPYFDVSYHDLYLISKHCRPDRERQTKADWIAVLADRSLMHALGVRDVDKIHTIYQKLTNWIREASTNTLQVLFEKVITQSGVMDYALSHPDRNWTLQLLTTLFDFIKNESTKNPQINIHRFLDNVRKMRDNRIILPFNRILQADNGVHFLTAHASKGLEFERLYLLGATKNQWESKRSGGSHYSYPGNLIDTKIDNDIEDERRLFFVAMTRAEKHLYISHAEADGANDNKALEPSRFVVELQDAAVVSTENAHVDEDAIRAYRKNVMTEVVLPEAELIDDVLIRRVLEDFRMSVTSLNKYLRCPITFYYENILRVPFARTADSGFGLAIHYALDHFFLDKQRREDSSFGSANLMTELFDKGMSIYRSHFTDKEYGRYRAYGHKILPAFHERYVSEWHLPLDFRTEYRVKNAHYKGVPITGMLDKVEFFKGQVNVIDYKTGKPERAASKMRPPADDQGGDYWRQIVFYKILLDNDPTNPWIMTSGEIDLVEPNKKDEFVKRKFVVSGAEVDIVGRQLLDTYRRIQNHEFRKGCNDDRCQWCHFVKSHVHEGGFVKEDYEEVL